MNRWIQYKSGPVELTDSLDSSLRLIHVDHLRVSVSRPGEAFGNLRRQVRGRFSLAGETYTLGITDPICEKEYLSKPNGKYETGEAFLTVSLGGPNRDAYCYKLIAAVIRPGKADET